MLKSVSLRNFKSFGSLTEIPLERITVLVGPNNTGKSNFLSVARFMRNGVTRGDKEAVKDEGGNNFLFHQPKDSEGELEIGWKTDEGEYRGVFLPKEDVGLTAVEEYITLDSRDTPRSAWTVEDDGSLRFPDGRALDSAIPFAGLKALRSDSPGWAIRQRMLTARLARLSILTLRADSVFQQAPELVPSGEGLASVLWLWRGATPDRATELDEFLRSCVPELKHILAKPSGANTLRLWFEEQDGRQFDAARASDGLLAFTALAMHIMDVGEKSVLFVEEPERGIHPRRLRELVDLMRRAARQRDCQLVLATHSPVIVDVFRDDPESIVLFRRGEHGTEVKRCTDLPKVVEALETAMPGELLETAFFDALWSEES